MAVISEMINYLSFRYSMFWRFVTFSLVGIHYGHSLSDSLVYPKFRFRYFGNSVGKWFFKTRWTRLFFTFLPHFWANDFTSLSALKIIFVFTQISCSLMLDFSLCMTSKHRTIFLEFFTTVLPISCTFRETLFSLKYEHLWFFVWIDEICTLWLT